MTTFTPRSARTALLLLFLGGLLAPPQIGTARADACDGDCNVDGAVTVDEILTMVQIALGEMAMAGCPAGDRDGDGGVAIDELVSALGTVMSGCILQTTGAPSATPVEATATATIAFPTETAVATATESIPTATDSIPTATSIPTETEP
ncbi:MAG TPA: hypothetical protein VEB21_10840, partial [Terriglobales bacterium]|nr:hypothetical protein [Terriglobales bacterium]